jgi:hypothetical protein
MQPNPILDTMRSLFPSAIRIITKPPHVDPNYVLPLKDAGEATEDSACRARITIVCRV